MGTQERKLYIDVLRIMATLMIMFNHTSTFGFALYTVRTDGILYWIYLFLAISAKTAVPIFFMISGGLLLEREETLETLLKKRFLRFVIVLLAGTASHYAYFANWERSELSMSGLVERVFSGNMVTPYWYLYSYLGFLLMLPILRKLVSVLQTQDFVYLIGMYFLMKLLSVVQFLVWKGSIEHSPYFSFFIMGDNIFYPLLGYFVEHRLPQKFYEKKYTYVAALSAIVTVGVCCVLTFLQSRLFDVWDEGSTQTFFNTFIFVPAGCLYFIIKYWFAKHFVDEKISRKISAIGECTFGVYVFETIYREETKRVLELLIQYFPTIIACGIWIICAFAMGSVVTLIIKQIPGIRKIF